MVIVMVAVVVLAAVVLLMLVNSDVHCNDYRAATVTATAPTRHPRLPFKSDSEATLL